MANKIKIIYFDARARAEVPRLVLAAAKKPWEDVYIASKDWPAYKPSTPFGSLPVLDLDGEQYGQGLAIATYLAKEYGLSGATNREDLEIDQLQQLREELLIIESQHFKEGDPAKKAEKAKALKEEIYPRYLGFFTNILNKNGGEWAVGKKLSLADLVLFAGTTTMSQNNPEVLDKFPQMKNHRQKIAQINGIKEHLAMRNHSVI